MLAGAHKKSERVQHTEIYLLGLKVQYKHKTKLPLDMVSKRVLLSVQRPDYVHRLQKQSISKEIIDAEHEYMSISSPIIDLPPPLRDSFGCHKKLLDLVWIKHLQS